MVDKNAIANVFGCLMHQPSLLIDIGEDYLNQDDFQSRFYKTIFISIGSLMEDGFNSISEIDIDSFLKGHEGLYAEFDKNNGLQYLHDCLELSDPSTFRYYAERIKKFSALRLLQKRGFDISSIWKDDYNTLQEETKYLARFESLSPLEIFDEVEKSFMEAKSGFFVNGGRAGIQAHEGMRALKERYKQSPEIGRSIQGELINSIILGARKGRLYMNSGSSGSGKSRTAFGNACFLSIPEYYVEGKGWIKKSGDYSKQKSLIISTEMGEDEVQTILIANISGVNEKHITLGIYKEGEEERVDRAIDIFEEYKDNLFIEVIDSPCISNVTSVIKKYAKVEGISYFFYDYIFVNTALLGELKDFGMRPDSALVAFTTELKALAESLKIFIWTSTQLSQNYIDYEGVRDEMCLQDAKSLLNKIDIGMITCKVTDKDKQRLLATRDLGIIPTHVCDIYKNRSGEVVKVRVWQYLDLGTARVKDLFVTDGNYNVLEIDIMDVHFQDEFDAPPPIPHVERVKKDKPKVSITDWDDL